MDDEISTARLAKLFDVTPKTIADLGKRGIIEGKQRREAARKPHKPAHGLDKRKPILPRPRRGSLRASLSRRARSRSYGPPSWRAFRNRIFGIPQRVQYLSARQTVVLMQELRA